MDVGLSEPVLATSVLPSLLKLTEKSSLSAGAGVVKVNSPMLLKNEVGSTGMVSPLTHPAALQLCKIYSAFKRAYQRYDMFKRLAG